MRTIAIALLVCLVSSQTLTAAELLLFRGSFAPIKVEEGVSLDKSFTVQLIRDGERTAWTLAESGRGGWPWPERFGTDGSPALLYDRGDGFSTVPLPAFFADEPNLANGSQWQQAGLTYRVVGEEKAKDTDAWQVLASDPYGPKRRLLVAKDDRRIIKIDDRVFVGQGTECKLQWELIEHKTLETDVAVAALRDFDALVALRSKLELSPRTRET